MNNIDRVSATPDEIAEYIAQELEAGSAMKNIYILANNPSKAEAITKRCWRRRVRKLLRQRAIATDPIALIKLSSQIALLESVTFAVAPPADLLEADVLFVRPDELEQRSPYMNALIIETSE